MISIGFFSEMNISAHDDGSIKEHICKDADYDKEKIIKYLSSFKHKASCSREAIDCMTGETISPSFRIYNDGEYCWADFLIYHIQKYNIKLPQHFVEKIMTHTA